MINGAIKKTIQPIQANSFPPEIEQKIKDVPEPEEMRRDLNAKRELRETLDDTSKITVIKY